MSLSARYSLVVQSMLCSGDGTSLGKRSRHTLSDGNKALHENVHLFVLAVIAHWY